MKKVDATLYMWILRPLWFEPLPPNSKQIPNLLSLKLPLDFCILFRHIQTQMTIHFLNDDKTFSGLNVMTLLGRKLKLTNHKRHQKLSRVECTQVCALIYADGILHRTYGCCWYVFESMNWHNLHLWNCKDGPDTIKNQNINATLSQKLKSSERVKISLFTQLK